MFILFGHGWEFYVIIVVTCIGTVGGLAYFVWMTAAQARFLDQYLDKHVNTDGETKSSKRTALNEVQLASSPI